jgi:septal ring factor EnvC (AmiA/AmiB activator)
MPDATFMAWITSAAPPMYALALGCAVLAVRFYPHWKQKWTEARTAEDAIVGNQWKRFQDEIDRLVNRITDIEKKCDRLEASEERCKSDLADAKRRIAELEGYDEGQGRARQEAAGIVARERAEMRAQRPDDPQNGKVS